MNEKYELGKLGEKIAIDYLKQNGINILIKNFRYRKEEIDVIAKDKNEIVFIEVKARSTLKYGMPIEAVDKRKMQHILNTARYYLYINKLEDCYIRFDVIEIYKVEEKYYVKHHKQVL